MSARDRLQTFRRSTQGRTVAWLTLLSVALGAPVLLAPDLWPVTLLAVPLVLGSLLLEPRVLSWFTTFVLVVLAVLTRLEPDLTVRIVLAVGSVFVLGIIMLLLSFRRARLGVAGATGESLLVDLRDRIQRQGMLPDLPEQWYVDSALRSAGGTPFAGDFLVAVGSPDRQRLAVAVVDVSGKGIKAGSRSLLLTGALGGLLGSLPAADFLSAANDYLIRQQWGEGFATAVHLSIDLASGAFEVRSAGHPPAVHLHAGSGRWQVHEAVGPVLGVIEGATYDAEPGRMLPGDTLLLYTDGMVETRQRDLDSGIDKLIGAAERLVRTGVEGGARHLVDAVGSADDDRALFLLHRNV